MLKMNSDLALLAPAKPFSAHLPIQFEGVHLSFGKHLIFSNLNLEIGAQGITAIMGGHTHDAVPRPVEVKNANSHRGRSAVQMLSLMRERWF